MAVYVIYTMAGNEHKIELECREKVLAEGEDVYVPMYCREKKKQGEKIIAEQVLFPGYVFYESENIEDVRIRLKEIKGMARFVGAEGKIIPLYEEEADLINKLCGKDHRIDISEAIIEGGKARVIQGPLKGMDSKIIKVNKKKRRAVIQAELFGRKVNVTVGMNILHLS